MYVEWLLDRTARVRRGALFHYDRNVYLLLLFTLGKGFQLSIAAVSTNLYVYSLGYRPDFIGLFAAMPAIGALVAGVPTGLLADRLGRRSLLIAGGLLNPVALAAVGLSTGAPLLIAASLVNGVLSSSYWVTNLPMLTESTTDDQRVGVLALNSFLLLGVGALGALIGGAVPELAAHVLHTSANGVVPLRCGVLAAAIIVFLPALPLVLLRESPRPTSMRAAPPVPQHGVVVTSLAPIPSISEPADPVGRLATAALFAKLLVPDVLFTTGEGSVVALLQVYFVLRFHLQPGTVGILYTMAGLTGGGTSLLSPRLVRRWGSLRTATAMQYLSIPAMLTTGFAPVLPLAAVGEFGRATLRGFFDPVYAAFALHRVSRRLRGTLSGFYSMTWSIGYTLGAVLAGRLQQHVGLSAPFVIGTACVATSATLLRIFFGRAPAGGRSPAGG